MTIRLTYGDVLKHTCIDLRLAIHLVTGNLPAIHERRATLPQPAAS